MRKGTKVSYRDFCGSTLSISSTGEVIHVYAMEHRKSGPGPEAVVSFSRESHLHTYRALGRLARSFGRSDGRGRGVSREWPSGGPCFFRVADDPIDSLNVIGNLESADLQVAGNVGGHVTGGNIAYIRFGADTPCIVETMMELARAICRDNKERPREQKEANN